MSRSPTRASRWLSVPLIACLVLFLALLPFHLVVKRIVPGPLGTYWKEALLALLVVLAAIWCLRSRQTPWTSSPLDWAVLVYAGLILLRFVTDRPGWITAWGLYASAMYLPLFWIVPLALRDHPRRLTALIGLLVALGTVVALGGLIEFALDRQLWPSTETVLRQGFPDVFIYGTQVRRVYFTFDSPTTLANALALLLPLALSLLALPHPKWLRPAAALAAALMAACIVVTFSRGIWVAAVFSLIAMGLLTSVVQRNWRALLVAATGLVLIGGTWGLVSVLQPGDHAPTMLGVVELSPAAYAVAPVTRVTHQLLYDQPLLGDAAIQTWTVRDPITGHDDTRDVLFEHPPESGKHEIIYRVTVPEDGALRFAAALAPEVWSPDRGDGASFQVFVTESADPGSGQPVFVRYVNPKHSPSDRRWRNFLVDLSPWAGTSVNLSLITEAGPTGDWAFDWAGWADPQVVRVEPGFFVGAQPENAILHHTGSILDWARDETNRDRLAAWSLALDAWRASPLWGSGLGSTGVAALRTTPESAYVTESQVLKSLAELGLPGLLALGFLWFEIARTGRRTYRRTPDALTRALLVGILTSLLVIFIEGWVYQNLEVKQVNAYFWTLVGSLAFLAARTPQAEADG